MPPAPPFGDFIHPFRIEGLGVHGRLVRLGAAAEGILAPHAYPPAIATMMGEAVALAAALAGGLKFDGMLTLQTQGDGPLGMMVANVSSDGDMRGYARFDAGRLDAVAMAGDAVPALLGEGHLAFTMDQGEDTDLYQGITALGGATLADTARAYFRQSEQLETAIVLAATPGDDNGARAAALMLQHPPAGETEEDSWRRAEILTDSVTTAELLDPALTPSDILFRLYHGDGVRVFRPKPLRFACRCSSERVENTLRSFPRAEIEDMKVDGRVFVTCEFCKADYTFDETAIETLYAS